MNKKLFGVGMMLLFATLVGCSFAYTLVVDVDPEHGGTVTVQPEKDFYAQGEIVELEAIPSLNYRFSEWGGDLAGADPAKTVTMNNNREITAYFVLDQPPEIAVIEEQLVQPGEAVSFSVQATDPDGDEVTLNVASEWTDYFDPETGEFFWVTTQADVGIFHITFTATSLNLSSELSVTVRVEEVANQAPVFQAIGDQTGAEGEQLTFSVTATDPDGDNLTYSASGDLTEYFDQATQKFNWTPGYEDAGTYSIIFQVSDGQASVESTVSIDIINTNQAPWVETIHDQSVIVGDRVLIYISALDPEGDPLSFRMSGDLTAYYDATNKCLDWQTTESDAGVYTSFFHISDGANTHTEEVNIVVNPVIENLPPVIEPIGDQEVNDGGTLSFTVQASDPNGDQLTYEMYGPLAEHFNPETQTFTYTPSGQRAWTFRNTFQVSDGEFVTREYVDVKVINLNQRPELSVNMASCYVGYAVNKAYTAYDPDGDQITYWATGELEDYFYSANDAIYIEWEPQPGDEGSYVTTIHAYDGNIETQANLVVSVNGDGNARPSIRLDDREAGEGEQLRFPISGYDLDFDTLSYSATGDLVDYFSFDGTRAIFDWTPGYQDDGEYVMTFEVSDGEKTASDTITITITDTNRPPEVGVLEDIVVDEGTPVNFQFTAIDSDEDPLSYRAQGLLMDYFNPATQTFDWTPGPTDSGTYHMVFEACDGIVQTKEYVDITVNDLN